MIFSVLKSPSPDRPIHQVVEVSHIKGKDFDKLETFKLEMKISWTIFKRVKTLGLEGRKSQGYPSIKNVVI